MRASTATIILTFCSMLATFAAPAPIGPGGLAVRDADLGDALSARAIEVEARETDGEIGEREAKKRKKGRVSYLLWSLQAADSQFSGKWKGKGKGKKGKGKKEERKVEISERDVEELEERSEPEDLVAREAK